MTIWRMGIAFSIPKATNTNSEYVSVLLSHGNNCYANAPILSYTYIKCLVMFTYNQIMDLLGRNM